MDLLQGTNQKNKNEKTKTQKIILTLLIISIVLCIIVGSAMAYLSIQGEEKPYSITVNGKSVNLSELQVMSDASGHKYVALKPLSSKLGYYYYNGEFKIADEGKDKGYINTNKNIVQFFADSKEIYKAKENSNTDYEYYTLNNIILEYEGNIYIAIDDLAVALNLILDYSEKNNQTTIETPEHWVEQRVDTFKQNNIIISETPENLRALSYGYLIISENDKFGVISLSGNELIGNKYSSITFCEYKGNFIVSDTQNKFGVIAKSGLAEIDLQYDSLEIINYNPLLYKVKRLEKYGVIRENGSIINEIKYDSIAYPENKAEEINYTLIVPNLNENIPQSIVVCADKKYGLIELETGKEIVPCMLEGIYSKAKNKTTFYAKIQKDKEYALETFVENFNRLTTAVD